MPLDHHPDDQLTDPGVRCSDCAAVCCRLIVQVKSGDRIPPGLTRVDEQGMRVMARAHDGWCVALDRHSMACSIYAQRPDECRRFVMGAGYCRELRRIHGSLDPRPIPSVPIDAG